MRSFLIILFVFVDVSLALSQVDAPLSLPSIISDNMILQQKAEVPIWGRVSSGQEVVVKASWLDAPVSTTADKSGNWEVKLLTNSDVGLHSILFVSRHDTLLISNILFGEVWVASGQSNMQMPLKGWEEQNIEGSEDAIKLHGQAELPVASKCLQEYIFTG